jgi:demethylmenaquinone methyltransferase/2-methoxy-6-polyprenyl-1,4-benzoquinol methylase
MRPEERRYYELRAPEYDDWYLGHGLYAERERAGWDEETARLTEAVAALPSGRVLDVACGTGFLTRHLRGEVAGLDRSPRMLELARARCPEVRFVEGDALELPFEDGSFDLVFTGHFYGHLREPERERFLREARRVAPRLVVVDSALRAGVEPEGVQERVLEDGSRHLVYKRYFDAAALAAELGGTPLFSGAWYVVVAA